MAHSRDNFAAFEHAGGRGEFLEFDMPFGQGHLLAGRPDLWSGAVSSYLKALSAADTDRIRP
ncbi:MAG TPA: hypothetical protein VHC94_13845 [Nitrobacter sp.]|nr:hypothetical protein [Nitrobacter sp.]